MVRGKPFEWDRESDKALLAMVKSGMSHRSIAKEMGINHPQVSRRLAKLREQEAEKSATNQLVIGKHLPSYKAARRGFHVPAHLEPQYFELLKSGVPIAEACRRLGINKHDPV
ncbi:protein of unknown function [Pseudorhizobium banfieldiae]|uniref:Uncharacterized protein n=1 Tax=Pseudorhizobium banfieldiae TaxID=1125847 RepID=L0NFM1_9HYPH|nr:hypothetical protein [Pseudorhizobium banfieldiae]CAD6605963.1 hypothetical protein RNT25_01755 [arsenite-oxidising bacterium NT-25]CCF19102.1 protein of unknown function [Pseudorhizobium banfieldiae]